MFEKIAPFSCIEITCMCKLLLCTVCTSEVYNGQTDPPCWKNVEEEAENFHPTNFKCRILKSHHTVNEINCLDIANEAIISIKLLFWKIEDSVEHPMQMGG